MADLNSENLNLKDNASKMGKGNADLHEMVEHLKKSERTAQAVLPIPKSEDTDLGQLF